MLYDISLKITYDYEVPVSGGRHLVRVMPATLPGRQRLIVGSLSCQPTPAERAESVDFFANPFTAILFRSSHADLTIRMQARVQVEPQPLTADFSPGLDGLPAELSACWSVDAEAPHHFTGPSPLLPEVPDIAAYAQSIVTDTMTIRQIATALCERIHRDFTYDGEATTVNTTPGEAFKLKRGVCQDFTHVMIVALRSLGIPAGYVSGFLRTIPPPGKERLEGADAMHAWVRIWCGTTGGWLELDPTNNIPAGTDHIVVGHGRDYGDVAPVIGVLKSYGSQTTKQAVDVIPVP
ncbi:transglutaminase domain-containing protein [Ensifer sp. 2YAB10]|uniref:transglutaminase family protein n=1 Tax=unclassified Ensifer TaxID=2633371 RepID=UPI000DE4D002|nr:transglutaminase family protein [Ensifer sp. SSB1]MBK5565910.1 transglutaminase family protein [Ensifer sp. SSB1]